MKTIAREVLSLLPEVSFADGKDCGLDCPVVAIHRAVPGYKPICTSMTAEEMNSERGVTPAQASAMLNGSMFGWHVPAADPRNPVNVESAQR